MYQLIEQSEIQFKNNDIIVDNYLNRIYKRLYVKRIQPYADFRILWKHSTDPTIIYETK